MTAKPGAGLKILITLIMFTTSLAVFAEEPKDNTRQNTEVKQSKDDSKVPSINADEIVKGMDKTISGYEDQIMDATMNILSENGTVKSYEFEVSQKGQDKRLIRFTSGEIKGMSILSEASGINYVYLPGFKRVRRISASNMNQSMAGSDFTNDDMGANAWAETCHSSIIEENKDSWKIKCTPKSDNRKSYSYLIFTVLKNGYFQARVDYFNKDNVNYKRMTNENMTKWPSGFMRFQKITMENMLTGHKTTLDLKSFSANQNLKDSLFTVRRLKWRR